MRLVLISNSQTCGKGSRAPAWPVLAASSPNPRNRRQTRTPPPLVDQSRTVERARRQTRARLRRRPAGVALPSPSAGTRGELTVEKALISSMSRAGDPSACGARPAHFPAMRSPACRRRSQRDTSLRPVRARRLANQGACRALTASGSDYPFRYGLGSPTPSVKRPQRYDTTDLPPSYPAARSSAVPTSASQLHASYTPDTRFTSAPPRRGLPRPQASDSCRVLEATRVRHTHVSARDLGRELDAEPDHSPAALACREASRHPCRAEARVSWWCRCRERGGRPSPPIGPRRLRLRNRLRSDALARSQAIAKDLRAA